MEIDVINRLKQYATWHIVELAKKDSSIEPLATLMLERFGPIEDDADIISDESAQKYVIIPQSEEEYPGENFDRATRKDCYDIAVKTLTIACLPKSTNLNMIEVARYLHPLLSLDDATVMIGFDLEEYIDWYFADTVTIEKRKEKFDELIKDWEYVQSYLD